MSDLVQLLSGHQLEFLKGDEQKEQDAFHNHRAGVVRLLPQKFLMPASFAKGADNIYSFKPEHGDVLVATYPKCGTTWVQEIVWTMRNNPNLDNKLAEYGVNYRTPFLEFDYILDLAKMPVESPLIKEFYELCPDGDNKEPIMMQLVQSIKGDRTYKTHLPLSLLNQDFQGNGKAKTVYILRNPKDLCISYFHHNKVFADHSYEGTLEDFTKLFVEGKCMYGCYSDHLREAFNCKDNPNFYIAHYEDLKNNTLVELKKLDSFLGTNLTEQQLINVMKYTSFEEMKERNSLMTKKAMSPMFNADVLQNDGGFFRKGVVGDYKSKLTKELEGKIDEWVKEKCKDIDVEFKYKAQSA